MNDHNTYQEGARILAFLRALGNEDQCIAYAILAGMRLQKDLDSQKQSQPKAGTKASA